MHYRPVEHSEDDVHVSGPQNPDAGNMGAMDDDVWGGDEEAQIAETVHPSDMRRLEAEHTTAGYREGIAKGKEDTLQKGFDQGYSSGAAIGLQAGQLLGTLEGIAQAVEAHKDKFDTAEKLLQEALAELSVEKIFASEFWTAEGLPKYEVPVSSGDRNGHSEGALSHPIIHKWTAIVDEQMSLWGIDRTILQHLNSDMPEPQLDEGEPSTDLPARDPLAW
jgi:hypothetical protein